MTAKGDRNWSGYKAFERDAMIGQDQETERAKQMTTVPRGSMLSHAARIAEGNRGAECAKMIDALRVCQTAVMIAASGHPEIIDWIDVGRTIKAALKTVE